MGWYGEHVLPRMIHWAMANQKLGRERAHTLAGLSGRVLEVGFGSGLNLPHYPPEVTELLALEPSRVARELAAPAVVAAPFPVEFLGLRGEEVPLDTASVDAVVSTWTLCTIPDVARALGEIARVLRPGAPLHFIEHGLAEEPRTQRWQRRLEPLQKRAFGGCHLTRPIDALVRAAGLELPDVERWTFGRPHALSAFYRGVARRRG
jgi:SAM-dependent methyltransferase